MTVFAHFTEEFPDREETRIILMLDKATLKERERWYLDERYCADPECDCQQVMLYVLDQDCELRAVIGYDLLARRGRTPRGENPFLEPGEEQPDGAEQVLAYVKSQIDRDSAYRERLSRHYGELKQRMRDPAHPLWPEVLEDRRMMKRFASKVVRGLVGTTPSGPSRERREINRRKRVRKRR